MLKKIRLEDMARLTVMSLEDWNKVDVDEIRGRWEKRRRELEEIGKKKTEREKRIEEAKKRKEEKRKRAIRERRVCRDKDEGENGRGSNPMGIDLYGWRNSRKVEGNDGRRSQGRSEGICNLGRILWRD